jgi:hypothetical protein
MKHFSAEWTNFARYAAIWSQLCLETRKAFLELKSNQHAPAAAFQRDLERMLSEKLLTISADRRSVQVHDDARAFSRALRAMRRQPIFDSSTADALLLYLQEHMSSEELDRLARGAGIYYGSKLVLARKAAAEEWLTEFLAADPQQWERERIGWGAAPAMQSAESVEAVRTLLLKLMPRAEPVALAELPSLVPELSPRHFDIAVDFCVRFLLLFAGMLPDTTPVIGLWPGAARRLNRPEPQPPAAASPVGRYALAYRLEDMTTLLVAAAEGKLRVRAGSHELFDRARDAIMAELVEIPDWVANLVSENLEIRVGNAQRMLRFAELLEYVGQPGKGLRVAPAAGAVEWLAQSRAERLKTIFDRLQLSKSLLPHRAEMARRNPEVDFPRAIADAYAGVPKGRFVSLKEFLQWRTRTANPLLERAERFGARSVHLGWERETPTNAELELFWGEILVECLLGYLVPLGGAELGYSADRNACFALTDAGRYALGLRDDFEYGRPETAAGAIVVQPNFDVVFLKPYPLAEATIARFAQRTGSGLGALFKITKASVMKAAAAGIACEQALDALRGACGNELPANVEREITGWFAACRSITVRSAVLMECPDPQTAAHVAAASGGKAVLLNETLVELRDPASQSKLLQKLKKAGIFARLGDQSS